MEMLSEHTVEGWLEGYILSGRHGLINSYEPFIHVIDSMFNQHAKWLEKCNELPWRATDILAQPADHRAWSGGRTTMASRTRTQDFSTWWPTKARALCASTCRPTPTVCSRSPTTACAASTTSTSSSPTRRSHLQYLDMEAAIAHCTKGARHLELGQQRPGRRTRRGHGELRRCADDGVPGRHRPASRSICPT